MERGGCVYIMSNKNRSTLYIGVTSDLPSRIFEHKFHTYPSSFTAKYNLESCIYFESYATIVEAIAREKELKKWRREKKFKLIIKSNPSLLDLSDEINSW